MELNVSRLISPQENEYYLQKLNQDVPTEFLNGRLFHYSYLKERALHREAIALDNRFNELCNQLLSGHNKFITKLPPGRKTVPLLDFKYLPQEHWPDRNVVWDIALSTCPYHLFANTKTNYLLYACDPIDFRRHYTHGNTSVPFTWSALFGHAATAFGQLDMLIGMNLKAQADEYNDRLPQLRVLPLFLQQMNQARNDRFLPANSVSDWTDYVPPKEWQLQQVLARTYISNRILQCWIVILNYTGVMYSAINDVLRQHPNNLRQLSTTQPYMSYGPITTVTNTGHCLSLS